MSVNPATISIKPEDIIFIIHPKPIGKWNEAKKDSGKISDKSIHGKKTQRSKGKLIRIVHFFIKIKDK